MSDHLQDARLRDAPTKEADPAEYDDTSGLEHHRLVNFLPGLVLLLGLTATFFLQQSAFDAARQIQQVNFFNQTHELTLRIAQRLSAYEQILLGVNGLYLASKSVERDEFHKYAGNLRLADNYPGIQGIGFSQIIPPRELKHHIESIRKEGFPGYTPYPAGERDIFTSIIYLEPFSGRNLRAFGFDMYSDPVRRTAMEQARDLDKPVMSGKVTLMQESDQKAQAGFLIYTPVYRNDSRHDTLAERRASIIGWVYAPFRMNDLMQGILGDQKSDLDYEIFDGEQATPETLMYDNDNHLSLRQDRSLYHDTQRLNISGRVWTLKVRSLVAFEKRADTKRDDIIRVTGMLVSILLALLVWQLITGRMRALRLAQDMTQWLKDAKKSEANALVELRFMLNTSGEGYWKLDRSGCIVDVNEAYCRLTGYDRGEIVGAHIVKFEEEEHTHEAVASHLQRITELGSDRFETRHRHHDGHLIDIEVVTAFIPVTDCFIVFLRDVTERKEALETLRDSKYKLELINNQLQDAQHHLQQSEKMASIGQLAAGVAHEINNPIGYVYSNLGTLEKYVQDTFSMLELYEQAEGEIGDPAVRARIQAARDRLDIVFLKEDLRALMSESKDGITRVKTIVQNLKDFSHVDISDEWHLANLHQGLDSTLNIVNNEIKYKAEVVKEYGDLPEVACLSSQLNQVFMNLLVNAAHAIEARGTITIRTGRVADEVWVEICDTGKGIDQENLKKIFDPFFTTKPIGQGTGLGLSLSYGIIKKHHGRIEVSSIVGKGTVFRVWLPVRQRVQHEPEYAI